MLTHCQPTKLLEVAPAVYRPDIDGLRAVSILSVVVYHAFPAYAPGGFVGVDFFFVISGFLITRIIITELVTGTFSVAVFYHRRIRRIFPALIVVLVTTYAVGWLVLLPRDFKSLSENITAGAAFFANLLQARGQDYFAPAAADNPLLHLWSLGIEEQFYIFWPVLLVFLKRRGVRNIVIAAIAVGSLAANLFLVSDHQAIAFYSPFTRIWGLLAGALLAANTHGGHLRYVSDDVKGAVGLLLIVVAIGLLDRTSNYPGWRALIPVAGAVLLLDAGGSIVNRRLLSHPIMTFIGLVSYPLYL